MNFDRRKHNYGLASRAVLLTLAIMLLPMAFPKVNATDSTAGISAELEPRRLPWIEKTSPPVGASGVDPNLKEISVTFDRDMGGGMSWTGDRDSFLPPFRHEEDDPKQIKRAYWTNNRTCVLPVKLSSGQYYRVGINSTSHRNFKSWEGESAPCSVFTFVTKDATKSMESRVRIPKIVKLQPKNGSEDVDPKTERLSVTFDTPMGKGMSWTGGGENFPKLVAGQAARWTSGGKTCVLTVKLKPSWHYILGINSLQHINFQSKWGVPAEPVEYRFTTSEE